MNTSGLRNGNLLILGRRFPVQISLTKLRSKQGLSSLHPVATYLWLPSWEPGAENLNTQCWIKTAFRIRGKHSWLLLKSK